MNSIFTSKSLSWKQLELQRQILRWSTADSQRNGWKQCVPRYHHWRNWEPVALWIFPKEQSAIRTECELYLNPFGNRERIGPKVPLVSSAISQIPWTDFLETFSPVSKNATMRFKLALKMKFGCKRWQNDVENAFAIAPLSEETYTAQPQGFENQRHKQKMYRLRQGQYGLKQASRCPNAYLQRLVDSLGLQ